MYRYPYEDKYDKQEILRRLIMPGTNDRKYWIETLIKISDPVLTALSKRELKKVMPVDQNKSDRSHVTHLEALGRTLVGIAPWLELETSDVWEGKLIKKYAKLSREAIDAGTDPESPDYMNFGFEHGYQPIVDAAFLSHAIIRAPRELWDKLDSRVKLNVVNALKKTREGAKPGYNNWLLFSAMIEAALYKMGEPWDQMRVDYAIRQHQLWYVGDGVYSDGPDFHWDYYNSFVIQPMLLDILQTVGHFYHEWMILKEPVIKRAQRYAAIQERLITEDGSYPPVGRSIAYRFGAFQSLAQISLMKALPQEISPSQVRCAMTAVIKRTMEAPGTFDENGWLRIGLCGNQPGLGEGYISTGSLYLCTAGLLPLGLPGEDEFWSGEDIPWTWKKIWNGEDMPADHAIKD